MIWKERAKKLLDDHWKYHEILIPIVATATSKDIEQLGEWYKQIGFHFYKHAIEDISDGVLDIKDFVDDLDKLDEDELGHIALDCLHDLMRVILNGCSCEISEEVKNNCLRIIKSYLQIVMD